MRRDAQAAATSAGFGESVTLLPPSAGDPVTVDVVVNRLGLVEIAESDQTYEAAEVFIPRGATLAVPGRGWRIQMAMRDGGTISTVRVVRVLDQDAAGITVEVRS